jgi:NADH-quinone oxidoreductase subunit H
MPLADTELVVGPYTEYGGLRFALFLFAEYAGIVVLSGLTTVMFLGAWNGPGPAALGPFWTLAKVGCLVVLVVWIRTSWPRLREDQLQRLAWGALVPVALAQLALTAVLVVTGTV